MPTYEQKISRLLDLAARAERSFEFAKRRADQTGATVPIRHKCFVSYHGADIDAVTEFVEEFNDVFIPRVIGASDSDHFQEPINSKAEEYIKSTIASKYLSDTTVTILFVGRCAWSRKYIDWELSSSLRNNPVNRRNGLLAITPKDRSANSLPARFKDNWIRNSEDCYARYKYYPATEDALRTWIHDAYLARSTREHLIHNGRALRKQNSSC